MLHRRTFLRAVGCGVATGLAGKAAEPRVNAVNAQLERMARLLLPLRVKAVPHWHNDPVAGLVIIRQLHPSPHPRLSEIPSVLQCQQEIRAMLTALIEHPAVRLHDVYGEGMMSREDYDALSSEMRGRIDAPVLRHFPPLARYGAAYTLVQEGRLRQRNAENAQAKTAAWALRDVPEHHPQYRAIVGDAREYVQMLLFMNDVSTQAIDHTIAPMTRIGVGVWGAWHDFADNVAASNRKNLHFPLSAITLTPPAVTEHYDAPHDSLARQTVTRGSGPR